MPRFFDKPPPPASSPPPPPPPPRRPPLRSFGGYEIEGELGRGGMGVVYLARQVELNRHVALKMLTGHYGPEELRRFVEEAETAAGLSHTNIAHIYEVGEHEGAPYFSMEYVESGSLADRLRKDLPSSRDAAQLLIDVARALHFAHQAGIVHRDMKPANVLLDQDGVPKVCDFGIAKRLRDDSKLTRSGAVIGTPTYMAPEQAKGHSRHVGPAADVYALGAILYEMLTGRPPFLPEDSETAVTVRVLTEDPVSPAWHRPEVPRDLETICMKCLQKEPRARYASAAAVAEDLRRFLDDESILAKPPNTVVRSVKWVRRHPWKSIAALGAAMLLVASFLYLSYWVLYKRERTEYAATVKLVHGRIEPDVQISANDSERWQYSFRITRSGWWGPITRVELVNPHGHPAAIRQIFNYDVLVTALEGYLGMQRLEKRQRETTAIEFRYSGDDGMEATAFDRNQNVAWTMVYERPQNRHGQQTIQARFMDLRGYDIGQSKSASRAELERDSAGREVRLRFYDSGGQPQPNGEGVYGYTLEWNNAGKLSQLTNLGTDGKPALNYSGIAGINLNYNSRGQVSSTSYFGVDGNTNLVINSEYDGVGNILHLQFFDAGGKPVNSAAGFTALDYTRNQYGEATEIVASRLKADGTLEPVSRRILEYNANGYASDILDRGATSQRRQFTYDDVGNITEERLVDLDGKPMADADGWAIRRKSFIRTQNPPGWQEEETYFDSSGNKTYHKDGHHRTIIEFDEIGMPRLQINEEFDPKSFSYYRYINKPEFVGGKMRHMVSRYEDSNGQLTSNPLTCASFDSTYDDDEDEVLKWELACNVQNLGAPIFRTDTKWLEDGKMQRIRQALDENRQALSYISNGGAARVEQTYDDDSHLEHILESGFDQKVVGFNSREVKFVDGVASVIRKRADGAVVTSVKVFITSVTPEQPQSENLKAGDQLVTVNGKPVTSAFAWQSGKFPGGWIEIVRNGQRIRIDGFKAGSLGVRLEERAATLTK